ncbi:hypothetical protein HPULCUR_001528 [Helicostylum pulchrum]|uniref:Late endosomal/lysosomal adaptor and MAPK and MTOR activator 1 n=1 Tax=Helicostylum pulchrum TaxID=562976 RepID=A0ABP9XN22_9FUNG
MGCCMSRYDQVDERRPLLEESIESGPDDPKSIITKKMEAQVWKDIIERATKSMINNSTTQPLHPTDIEERTKRYTKILTNLPTMSNTTTTIIHLDQQQDISNVLDLLTDAKAYTDTHTLSDHVSKIDYAKTQINKSLIGHGHVVVYMKKLGRRI